MSKLNHKLQPRRMVRFELLESRELLSMVGLPDLPTAEVSPLSKTQHKTIKGTLSGQGFVIPISDLQGTAYFGSSGSTTVLGSSTFAGHVTYSTNRHLAVKYTKGVGILSDPSGDQIIVYFTGSGRDKGVGDYVFSVKGTVSGGTGSYTGAKGSFTGTGSLDIETHAFSIKLTVTLTHT